MMLRKNVRTQASRDSKNGATPEEFKAFVETVAKSGFPKILTYDPGSTNIAGWKMGAPDWVDVWILLKKGMSFQPAMWSFTRG